MSFNKVNRKKLLTVTDETGVSNKIARLKVWNKKNGDKFAQSMNK